MAGRQQLEKLNKVLKLYEQQLETLKANFMLQQNVDNQKRAERDWLLDEIMRIQNEFEKWDTTVNNLQVLSHLIQTVDARVARVDLELNEAETELESRRKKLDLQARKIKSLEKLTQRKLDEIKEYRRRRDQKLLDENYLNTKFSGMTK